MKETHVVAGVIWNAKRSHILLSKRADNAHQGGRWEFPGGKVEQGEVSEKALARELNEELTVKFERCQILHTIKHKYPEKTVLIEFFHVLDVDEVRIHANEGQQWQWVEHQKLGEFEFPEANVEIVQKILVQSAPV